MKHTILNNKNKSYGSKTTDNNVALNITQTTKQLTHNDIVGGLDVNEQFLTERNRCQDFRLTLTINPFCTNELFNTCTEIVWNEGADDCQAVEDKNEITIDIVAGRDKAKNVVGKTTGLNRLHMVRNSEYSSEKIGFEYHPGYDFFNNHILRNKSYRIVNPLPKSAPFDKKNGFNTIEDFMRLANGSSIQKCNRLEINDTTFAEKHLYDRTDILRMDDGESMVENLREENGWFGFYNTSVIPSKSLDGKILDINRAINNKGNCEFVDMYPDRSLFSFVPKYNEHRNRIEENWKIELTYPFEHTVKDDRNKDFYIVQSGNTNALAIASVEYVINQTGVNVLLFRTYTKHNLKANDNVYLYFTEDEDIADDSWHKSNKAYRVTAVGNLNGEYTDYYFSIYDSELLNNIFATTRDPGYSDWDYVRDYFYKQVTNGNDIPLSSRVQYDSDGLTNIPSANDLFIVVPDGNNIPKLYELYSRDTDKTYREMKQLDDKLSVEDFIRMCINNAFILNDEETSQSSMATGPYTQNDVYIQFRFTKAIGNNECKYYIRKFKKLPNMKNGHSGIENMPFDNEKYRLGYAETIYGDPIMQTVFTDKINVTGLEDNLGAEPNDIYVTIVKNNTGHNEWYAFPDPHYTDYTDQNTGEYHKIEYSHCFSAVTCGFDFFSLPDDNLLLKQNRKSLGDVKFIHNVEEGNWNSTTDEIRTLGRQNDITIDSEWFYGDIVEFNPNKYTETTLCDVNFRFNTAQRELVGSDNYKMFVDDIQTDDFDYDSFNIETHDDIWVPKKEGYYYKPHYKIKLRGYGPVKQDSHFNILVRSAEPIQNNGIFIKINTGLRHNCAMNDRLLLRDNFSSNEWELKVVSIVSPFSFIMTTVDRDNPNYIDWFTICEYLNGTGYSLKRVNESIPLYATRIAGCTFLWREKRNAWDIDNQDTDLKEYVFTNGCLYIDESINFYLKRQDPDNTNGLWPNSVTYPYLTDVEGERNKVQSIYAYKEEYEAIC